MPGTIEGAVLSAQRQFLSMGGVSGIGTDGHSIIFYVTTEAVQIPSTYMGYPTRVIKSGRFGALG